MTDKFKISFSAVLILLGISSIYFLSNTPLVLRLVVLIFAILLACWVAWSSEKGKQFYQYTQDSIQETKKVVWPTRKETVQTTGLVIAFVIVMALFLWIVDGLLVWVVRFLLGLGG